MTGIAILHATAGLHPRSGGTSRAVVDLADALGRQQGLQITLLTQSSTGEACLPNATDRVERVVAESRFVLSLLLGLPFRSSLKQLVKRNHPALIHNHGVWLPVNHWAARASREYRIPLIAQPHGMLEPWSLAHKAWKKRFAMALFQRRDLQTASLMIASSPVECDNLRKLGFRQPIAVIPNGVAMFVSDENNENVEAATARNRTVLFLSRIHPVKGLLNLVLAWARVSPQGWTLRIAGPDEGGHLAEVMAAVEKLRVQDSVEYVGEADADRKSALYRGADLFVLPSFTENFGIVVAEALAHGVPVVTTRGTPWADLVSYRCGWWVDIGARPLEQALREAMALSDEARRSMGARGREYVQRYDWEAISMQNAAVYRWMLGLNEKPECVITE